MTMHSPGPPGASGRPETPTRLLRLGSRLMLDAWSGDGQLLLRAGAKVQNLSEIERLARPDVRFGPERTTQIPLDLENEAALEAIAFLERRERAASLRAEVISGIQEVFNRLQETGEVDIPAAEAAASSLAASLMEDARALVSLVQIKDADTYTFTHSVNVGILAMYLALHTEYSKDAETIGVGALLHDIGKVNIDRDVLRKPGPLTHEEMVMMKQHPSFGADMLKDRGEKRGVVLSCVLSHHEKTNGRGYPEGRLAASISPHAMITSIVDIFDALTTHRPYRMAYTPKDALDLMISRMNDGLDSALLTCFNSIMGAYPVGSEVVLSDGCVGTVVNHYATAVDQPSVLVTADANGTALDAPRLLDLSKCSDLSVRDFVRPGRRGVVTASDVEQMRLAA